MSNHTRKTKMGYTIAAVPAVFFPVSYLVMACWVLIRLVPGFVEGDVASVEEPSGVLRFILLSGFYGTLIQWPFYLIWAAFSRELTIRVRMLWVGVIILLNMFAIPWFLYCKYHGTAQTALTRGIRQMSIRRFFEKGIKNNPDVL